MEEVVTIGSILWPKNPRDAVCSYLRFQLLVLQELSIKLPQEPSDPAKLADEWIQGLINDVKLDEAKDAWWSLIDNPDAITDFKSRSALQVRLALCLLSVRESDAIDLDEHISWFIEVLQLYGADPQKVIALRRKHFEFSPTAAR